MLDLKFWLTTPSISSSAFKRMREFKGNVVSAKRVGLVSTATKLFASLIVRKSSFQAASMDTASPRILVFAILDGKEINVT